MSIDVPKYKILVVGNISVGKTSIIHRFVSNEFLANYHATIGVDFVKKNLTLKNGAEMSLSIWDIAGHDRFSNVTPQYFRDAHGCIVIFDATDKKSYESREKWRGIIRTHAPKDIKVMLAANKTDVAAGQKFYSLSGDVYTDAMANLEEYDGFYEISAKNGHNVTEMFNDLALAIYNKSQKEGNKAVNGDIVDIRKTKRGQKKKSCSC